MFGVCVSCASICLRVCLERVCVFECVCLEQTSSVTLHIQSSPDGADSHFLRWLTAIHVINNNCSAVVPLPNNFSLLQSYGRRWRKFLFNFNFIVLNSFTSYISTVKLDGQARGVLRRSIEINTLGDECLLRMRAIIPILLTWIFYSWQHSIHCIHVDTGVLCDEVGHISQFFYYK